MKVLALDRDGVINFDSDSYILNKKTGVQFLVA